VPEKKLCFVVGPIGKEGTDLRIHADWVLHGIIEPVFQSYPEFTVKRADQDPTPGLITSQIITDLLAAELVVADLATLNANAFYEIGIRHMAQKPIIHLNPDKQDLPFDLSPYRSVFYSLVKHEDHVQFRSELSRAVQAVLAEGYQVENPVTAARGRMQLKEHATPEIQLVMDELEAINNRLNVVETAILPAEEVARYISYLPPSGLGAPSPGLGQLFPRGVPAPVLASLSAGSGLASANRAVQSTTGVVGANALPTEEKREK
jgi:hypothetical protein